MIGPSKIKHIPLVRENAEKVIILGGIGPNQLVLNRMAKAFYEGGYSAEIIHYPSTRHAIEPLVEDHLAPAVERVNSQPDKPLHFVTLSMGGIVFRQLLKTRRPPNLGRAVLVAPPNNGSEVADFFRDWSLFKWMFGPAGTQLVTGGGSVPKALGPVEAEVGVIAGLNSADPWFNPLFNHRHDGKVSVESAKVEGMADFITVKATHYDIMRKKETIRQALHFVRLGMFDHGGDTIGR